MKRGTEVLVQLKVPDQDRSIAGVIVEGFRIHRREPICLENAVIIEGRTPHRADGRVWIPSDHVAWVQEAKLDIAALRLTA